jgi:hypothetical protein
MNALNLILKTHGNSYFTAAMFDSEYALIKNSTHWFSLGSEQYQLKDGLLIEKIRALYNKGDNIEITVDVPNGKVIEHKLASW